MNAGYGSCQDEGYAQGSEPTGADDVEDYAQGSEPMGVDDVEDYAQGSEPMGVDDVDKQPHRGQRPHYSAGLDLCHWP